MHTDEQEGGGEEEETARWLRARDKAGRGPRGWAGKVHVWTRGQDEARGLTAVGVGALIKVTSMGKFHTSARRASWLLDVICEMPSSSPCEDDSDGQCPSSTPLPSLGSSWESCFLHHLLPNEGTRDVMEGLPGL